MRFSTVIFLLVLIPLFSACVSKQTYEQKVNETSLLRENNRELQFQLQQVQAEKKSLENRKSELEAELRETIGRNAALKQDLVRARTDVERIENVLTARGAEAGEAMAEMRRTIDSLEEVNRGLRTQIADLQQQVEQERLAREARIAQMSSTFNELTEKMEAEIKRGEVTISELQGKLTVNMVESILFDSGQADIKKEGLEVLRRVGDILTNVEDKEVRVEGHTDNVPISSRLRDRFPTNWELSNARAANVVHFLQEQVEIPGERLAACGYGPYRPIADNETPEGRAQNRRIQIVLVPLETVVATRQETTPGSE